MGTVILNRAQLLSQLNEQLNAIKLFSQEFDKGNLFVFKDIAVKLRILFHNASRGPSRSLCNQLGFDTIELYDSAKLIRDQATNSIRGPVYFRFKVDTPLIFRAELLPGLFQSNYQDWWEKMPIIINKNGEEFTRKEVVRYVTDNDGGAHVDTGLPEKYYNITRGDTSGWSSILPNGEEKYLDPIPAIIRQIAHEVLQTFDEISLL